MLKKSKLNGSMKTDKTWQDLLELTPKKDAFFTVRGWNAKGGSQEIPGVTGIQALQYRMKQGKG